MKSSICIVIKPLSATGGGMGPWSRVFYVTACQRLKRHVLMPAELTMHAF